MPNYYWTVTENRLLFESIDDNRISPSHERTWLLNWGVAKALSWQTRYELLTAGVDTASRGFDFTKYSMNLVGYSQAFCFHAPVSFFHAYIEASVQVAQGLKENNAALNVLRKTRADTRMYAPSSDSILPMLDSAERWLQSPLKQQVDAYNATQPATGYSWWFCRDNALKTEERRHHRIYLQAIDPSKLIVSGYWGTKKSTLESLKQTQYHAKYTLYWGSDCKLLDWQTRYAMFSAGGAVLARNPQMGYAMCLSGHSEILLVETTLFFCAFADICHRLARETQDVSKRRGYLLEAKGHIAEAKRLNQWYPTIVNEAAINFEIEQLDRPKISPTAYRWESMIADYSHDNPLVCTKLPDDSAKTHYQLGIAEIIWGAAWNSLSWQEKYAAFALQGIKLIEPSSPWLKNSFLRLHGAHQPLVCSTTPGFYYAAFGHVCLMLCYEADDVASALSYIYEAARYMQKATEQNPEWQHANITKKINTKQIELELVAECTTPRQTKGYWLGAAYAQPNHTPIRHIADYDLVDFYFENYDLAPLSTFYADGGSDFTMNRMEKIEMLAACIPFALLARNKLTHVTLYNGDLKLANFSLGDFFYHYAVTCSFLADDPYYGSKRNEYLFDAKRFLDYHLEFCDKQAKLNTQPNWYDGRCKTIKAQSIPPAAERELQQKWERHYQSLFSTQHKTETIKEAIALLDKRLTPKPLVPETTVSSDSGDQVMSDKNIAIRFGKIIGEGATGVVHLGTWNDKQVAIKRYHAHQLRNDGLKEFLKEAKFMATLESPYLVKTFDFVAKPPYYCIVMQHMQYGSLYDVLGSEMELPWDKRWGIAMDIAYGVAALHSKDIVHRDIKSLNVLIGEGFRAKLSDFGQVKIKSTSQSVKSRRGETGAVGTTAWLAPEILRDGAECSKETDMYSVGMVFWEIATREVPFERAPNESVMMHWICHGKREDINKVEQPKLAPLILSCWNTNAALRPSAQKAIEELNEVMPKHVSQQTPRMSLFSN